MSTEQASEKKSAILLVDDEPNITSALKRLLRKSNYQIFVASGGEQGLTILSENAIDVVISDMRMPNMDGAEFLSRVKKYDEKIIRILLTGYSDMSSTILAINDAEIFRYISKPWNDEDIQVTIKKGIELRELEKEKKRLEKLTKKQNKELLALNRDLESKVEFRTKKLKAMMDELQASNDEIKNSYLYIIKTFSSLTDMRGSQLAGHSRRVADNARKLAKLMKLDDQETQDVFFGSLLHDIGKIGLSDEVLSRPESLLSKTELETVKKHAVWGEGLLLGMDKFQNVAKIIRHHHERYDGSGYPDKLKGDDIPIGARLLAIVNDFDRLQSGSLSQKKYTVEEAINYLKKYKNRYYDPELVNKFIAQFKKEKSSAKTNYKAKKGLFTYQLKPGMVLSQDLLTKDRMMLLAKGHVLDENVIRRLIHHEKTLKEIFTVHIRIALTKY